MHCSKIHGFVLTKKLLGKTLTKGKGLDKEQYETYLMVQIVWGIDRYVTPLGNFLLQSRSGIESVSWEVTYLLGSAVPRFRKFSSCFVTKARNVQQKLTVKYRERIGIEMRVPELLHPGDCKVCFVARSVSSTYHSFTFLIWAQNKLLTHGILR